MNRRSFFKSAACLAAFPSSLLAYDGHCNFVITEFDKRKLLLKIEPRKKQLLWSTTPNEWGYPCYTNTVSKGPHEVVFGSLKDLVDCHNLCATDEIAAVIITQLQYSKNDLKIIWSIPWENTKEKERALEDLRRIKITEEECDEIYRVFDKLRGPHDCVLTPAIIA